MLAQYVGQHTARYPIRPFSLAHDLAALADLIEVAFGPELRVTGSHMVEDMRQVAQWGPVLHLVPGGAAFLTGYVWIEDRRLIGNASISNDDKAGVWTLSNVAVAPDQRGRGIAGHLVDAAIAHVRYRQGKRLFLEVRSDNASAIEMYAKRGFVRYDTVHELTLSATRWPIVVGAKRERLRGPRYSDGHRLLRLAMASVPEAVVRYRPPEARDFAQGWMRALRAAWRLALQGQDTVELVGPPRGELRAHGRVAVQLLRGLHQLELYVHPEERGLWEQELVHGLLMRIRHAPRSQVAARISEAHPEALGALHAVGFDTRRVLDQMVLVCG
jgi:ribosomal protein S18 acetylase RimI-like enzyme